MTLANLTTSCNIGITGATGFVGRCLSKRLIVAGINPVFIGRTDPGLGTFVYFDLSSPVKPCVPPMEQFVHVAAHIPDIQTDSELIACEAANGFGTLKLLEALDKKRLKRFILVSSCHIWDPVDTGRIRSAYEGSKLTGELFLNAYAARYGFEAVNLRLSYVYGPGMKHGRMFRIFFETALADKPLRLFNSGQDEIRLIYYDDAVDSIIAALDTNHLNGTFDICNQTAHRTADIAKAVVDAVNSKSEIIFVSGKPAPASRPDPGKAHKTFGFVAKTALSQGVKSIAETDYAK